MKQTVLALALVALLAAAAPARAESADAPPVYTLQHMTILDRFTADAELQKLRAKGYDAYLSEYTTQTGKIIYKLRSGRYPSRAEAVAASDAFAAKEAASVMIVTSREAGGHARAAAAPDAQGARPAVRVSVQAADNGTRPQTLQDKVNALKRGEAVQPARAKKPGDDTWFTVQTSTEPIKRAAEHRINKLRDKGYDAYCTEAMQGGRTVYKIRFGKYASADEASRAAESYSTSERRKCMVVKMTAGKDVELPPPAPRQAPDQGAGSPERQPAAARPEEAPEELDAAAEKPPEPAGRQKESEQAAAEDDDTAGRAAQASEPADKQPAEDPQQQAAQPERVSKIYAYREKSGALNLTNSYENIPAPLRTSIDYISLFPVRIQSLQKSGVLLTLEVDGEKKDVILGGLTLPRQADAARAYLESLQGTPLRLKYSPLLQGRDGAIAGRLYRKEGSYINLDMVRKGLGQYDPATLAPDQHEAFRQAQEAAKRDHLGMWK